MIDILFLPALIGLAALVSLGFRRSARLAWAALATLSLLFLGSLAVTEVDLRVFTWVKVFSLIFGAAWIHLLRFTRLGEAAWARRGMWLVLALNIAEAALSDFLDGTFVNAAVGLVLIATQAGPDAISIGRGRYRDLEWDLGRLWIVGYSLWNFAFVYRFYSAAASDHIAILGVPLLWIALRPRLWFQARGYVLSTYALTIVVWEQSFGWTWPGSVIRYSEAVYAVLVTGAALATVLHLRSSLRERAGRSVGGPREARLRARPLPARPLRDQPERRRDAQELA